MSILDSRTNVNQAKERLEAATDERLREDLAYWVAAAQDHKADFDDLTLRLGRLREQYAEAECWVGLIGSELRRRRDARRQEGG